MARMPSSRHRSSLNPQAASPQSGRATSDVPAHVQAEEEELELREKAARAGGFHESSLDLMEGLEVSESEWPDEITIPAPLGEH